jgi:hypothetical protein
MNTWPGGKRRAMHQSEHKRWNAHHYPGTRQLCDLCGDPTGRCEDDGIWSVDGEPLCEDCAKEHPECVEDRE